jgi:hypothetical protein
MHSALRTRLATFALSGIALLAAAAHGDEPTAEATRPPDLSDQIVVTGRDINQLRLRMRRDEDAVYARFNEINSTDRFDVRCVMRAATGTHIEQRVCESKGWEDFEAQIASASIAEQLHEFGPPPQALRVRQLTESHVFEEEFRRLAGEDPALKDALGKLARDVAAVGVLSQSRTGSTLERAVPADAAQFPADAHHMVDVRIGHTAWTHPLTEHTFTIASVTGRVRSLRIDCDRGSQTLQFEPDVEWSVPAAWSGCRVTVSGARDTTFAFIEF